MHSSAKKPQTIILDLNMPVMGGLDFRQRQRFDPVLKNIPVVIMSGEDDIEATRRKTDSEVIRKPLTILGLMTAIERVLKLN